MLKHCFEFIPSLKVGIGFDCQAVDVSGQVSQIILGYFLELLNEFFVRDVTQAF